MDTPTLIAIAVALAMDASAVAIGIGLCTKEPAWKCAARVALHFGLFQAGMTLAGAAAGSAVSGWVHEASNWAAAGLLWLVAAHMLLQALRRASGKSLLPPRHQGHQERRTGGNGAKSAPRGLAVPQVLRRPWCAWCLGGEGRAAPRDIGRGWPLLGLAVATSIDALGAGMGFAFLGIGAREILIAAGVIGLVAAALPAGGVFLARHLAARTGERFSRAANVAGALVLVATGIRIALWGG